MINKSLTKEQQLAIKRLKTLSPKAQLSILLAVKEYKREKIELQKLKCD